jgi:AI-2 transport protein TqsA
MTPATPGSDLPPPAAVAAARAGYSLEQVRTTCLLVLTVLGCGAVLAWLRPVVVQFLVALALFYLLAPIHGWLVRRFGVSEGWGVAGTAVIGLGVVTVTGAIVWACVAQVTRDADVYAARVAELSVEPAVGRVIALVGLKRDSETGRVVLISAEQLQQVVRSTAGWLETLLADTFLVLVFLLFMLTGGSAARTRVPGLPDEVAVRVRVYLVEMFAFSAVIGVLVGGVLGLLGVKFWLAFGFLAFVLNLIPTIGPIVAAVLPIPVVVLDPELAVWVKVLALTVPPTIHGVIANVIQPRFQSLTQGVHPVVTMLGLIVFGMLWGPVGAVLAVPLTGVLKIAFERIPGGQPFARLLAGQLDEGTDKAGVRDAPPEKS